MAVRVRQAVWDAKATQSDVADKIIVQNLAVIVNAGVDVWGREKRQRALVSVALSLAAPFDSAANNDALDASTVHYGMLSKDVQACIEEEGATWKPTEDLVNAIGNRVLAMAAQTNVLSTEVGMFYPKGSMLGDGVEFRRSVTHGSDSSAISTVLYLRNVRIPCLIGVNANERLQKQPVTVNVWVECVASQHIDGYTQLESTVVDAVSSSSFETLESLSAMVVQKLRADFFTAEDAGSFIRLRLEKPLAVPFADAPAIEILRPVKA